MSTTKLIWRGTREALDTLDTLLTEVLYPPADAVTLLKDDSFKTEDEANWALHAYFTELPSPEALRGLIGDFEVRLDMPEEEELPDIDWVAHALEGLGVVEAGKFIVYGSHDAAKAEASPLLPLQVEANRAFGTGHHPTTEGCLTALSQLSDEITPARILDVGTGSGILAMAARRLWPAAHILATDIDPPSIDIAQENAHLNGIADIEWGVVDGVPSKAGDSAPNLILANILAEPLMMLAPAIVAALNPGGTIVLAGLLARQEEAVRAAYEAQGAKLKTRVDDATWPVLILTHK